MNQVNPLSSVTEVQRVKQSPSPESEVSQQRLIFMESMCMQMKVASEQARHEADLAREAKAQVEIREMKLSKVIDQLELELSQKNQEIKNLSHKLSLAESKRADAENTVSSIQMQSDADLRIAQLEVQKERKLLQSLNSKFIDVQSRLSYLEKAYEKLFEKLFELYNLVQTEESDRFDLAEFISEMRAEIVTLEEMLVHSTAREESLKEALQLNRQNNDTTLGFSDNHSGLLTHDSSGGERQYSQSGFRTKNDDIPVSLQTYVTILYDVIHNSDRALAYRFIRELIAGPDELRNRAANRLIAMAGKHAASFIIYAAEHAETKEIRALLLEQLGKINDPVFIPVIMRFFLDADHQVRIAALDAAMELTAEGSAQWQELIQKAYMDSHPHVRRRVAIYATKARLLDPGPLCYRLLMDCDPTTRRLACTTISNTRDPDSALMVLQKVLDEDSSVSHAALKAAETIFGVSLKGLMHVDISERKTVIGRIIAYISASSALLYPRGVLIDTEKLKVKIPTEVLGLKHEQVCDQLTATMLPNQKQNIPEQREQKPVQGVLTKAAETSTAVKSKAEYSPSDINKESLPLSSVSESSVETSKKSVQDTFQPSPITFNDIHAVLLASIFGCTEDDVIKELRADINAVRTAIGTFVKSGQLVQRGKKIFLP